MTRLLGLLMVLCSFSASKAAPVFLSEVAKNLSLNLTSSQSGDRVVLSRDKVELIFEKDAPFYVLNGTLVYLSLPVNKGRSGLLIDSQDAERSVRAILTPQVFPRTPRLYHIVIDAGHGGKDPGASSRSVKLNEKMATLEVSRRLKKLLESAGYKVTLTRDTDVFVPLPDRSGVANQLKADLFVSIHFNSAGDSSIRGVETYVLALKGMPSTNAAARASDSEVYSGNYFDIWNTLVGYHMHTSLRTGLNATDRGLRRARFAVLKDLKCPGVLVECGYLSNPSEASHVNTASYREKVARSLFEGIKAYQRTLNRIRGK